MFYYVNGPLTELRPNLAVVEAGGVGYALTISDTTHAALAPKMDRQSPKTVKVYTHMSVREDGIELFGFASEDELAAFRLLISVSGVGPKAGISILSTLTPTKLAVAICTEDKKALSKANGIGAKTAARIILELKDKLSKESALSGDSADDNDLAPLASGNRDKLSEVTDALMVLGYSRSEALNALRTIDVDHTSLEDCIRAALKQLMK